MIFTLTWVLLIVFLGGKADDYRGIADPWDTDSPSSFDKDWQSNELNKFTFNGDGVEDNSFIQMHVIMNVESRTAISDPSSLWEDGVVPYKVSEKFDKKQKSMIEDAAKEFKEKTCVRFVPQTNEKQFLFITPGKGCGTGIGKFPDEVEQQMGLAKACFNQGIILHEMMHVLGFIHEHNRPDRDKYVKIVDSNIMEDKKPQFSKYKWDEIQTFNFSYDYGSVMHYGDNVFAKNRNESTIIPLKKGVKIGQRDGFSDLDLIKINKLYNCTEKNEKRSTVSSRQESANLLGISEQQFIDHQEIEIYLEQLRPLLLLLSQLEEKRKAKEDQTFEKYAPEVIHTTTETLIPIGSTTEEPTSAETTFDVTTTLDTTTTPITTEMTTSLPTTTTLPTTTAFPTTTAIPTTTALRTTTALLTTTTSETNTKIITLNPTIMVTPTEKTTEERDFEDEPSLILNIEDFEEDHIPLDSRKHAINYHKISIVGTVETRTALSDPSKQWVGGVVPYVFSDRYDAEQIGSLLEAVEEFNNKTCVRFINRTNEVSYIFVEPEERCAASIGFLKDRPNGIKISEGCYMKGTIMHEMMHVLGFIHEQNRPDRDQFVIIMYDNIEPRFRHNFRKYSWSHVQDFRVGYDFGSIMHYEATEFAIDDNRPTIVALQPGVKIGQREGFSKKDLIKINKIYNCSMAGVVSSEDSEERLSDVEEFKKYFSLMISRLFRGVQRTIKAFKPRPPS